MLEERTVLTGPQLQQVLLDGSLLNPLDTFNQAPREFIIRFDQAQQIDPTTLGGIQFIGSGGDQSFGTGNDQPITPSYIGIGQTPNEVVARFDQTLPEDTYRLSIVGSGASALRNAAQEAFNAGTTRNIDFNVRHAVQIAAVIPQPVVSGAGGLTQANNQIDVYFTEDMPTASVTNPALYQLILTHGTLTSADDVVVSQSGGSNPITAVSYDAVARKATLTFTSALAEGQYRLRIGNNDTMVATPTNVAVGSDPGESFVTAQDLGMIAGSPGVITSLVIRNQQISSADVPAYNLTFPGANDEPGHRAVDAGASSEGHVGGSDGSAGISLLTYSFPEVYGTDINGNPLFNQITEAQKQRAREVYELYGYYLGVKFSEASSGGTAVVTGDPRVLDPQVPPTGVGGIGGGGMVIMNGFLDWGVSEFGGGWFTTAMHEIGHSLGLLHASELPPLTIMGGGNDSVAANSNGGTIIEPVFPGDADILHGRLLFRPESRDIDYYKIDTVAGGTLKLETIAERRTPSSSMLNTVISVFDGNFKLIARNDDYYGDDSALVLENLPAGRYYIAVTSTENTDFDGRIEDSGMGGTTEGEYDLRVDFEPTAKSAAIMDSNLGGQILDGDGDGKEGGEYNFWFEAGATIYVDKTATPGGTGSLASPYDTLSAAIQAAGQRIVVPTAGGSAILEGDSFAIKDGLVGAASFYFTQSVAPPVQDVLGRFSVQYSTGDSASAIATKISSAITARGFSLVSTATGAIVSLASTFGTDITIDVSGTKALLFAPNIVRVVGNGGADGDLSTTNDATPYVLGPGQADGADLTVPQGVTLVIQPGVVLKLDQSVIDAGTSVQNIDRRGAAIQILGTPDARVVVTSIYDDLEGGDVTGTSRQAFKGDWGRINFGAAGDYESEGIFLNTINQANISYSGGAVVVTGVRPTITHNTIFENASAAISADPAAFTESDYGRYLAFTLDYDRVGLDVHGNTITDNTFNGLFVRTSTPIAGELEKFTAFARFDDADIVHVIGEDIVIAGNPGGPLNVSRSNVARLAAPGYVILEELASSVDQAYLGLNISIGGQTRLIVRYDGLTRTAFLSSPLAVVPTNLNYSISGRQARPDGRLAIDAGTILKLQNTRIEAEIGSVLIAEGSTDRPVVMTSIGDDSYGASGSSDTSNDNRNSSPAPGDWAGVYFSPVSTGSFDHVRLMFAGGRSDIAGDSALFNAVEIVQADVRIANSLLRFNEDGRSNNNRDGRGPTAPATISVRGAQPSLVGNTIQDNIGVAISINANALNAEMNDDAGRQTGYIAAFTGYEDNYGPLVRENILVNNAVNALVVRGAILTTESIWDDTDVVHALFNEIIIDNLHTVGGLRIQSSDDESLVVKLGRTSLLPGEPGFTASGTPLDIDDRIGGTLHIIGTASHPVVMTSLADDTVGAGFDLFGNVQTDTNNDGAPGEILPSDFDIDVVFLGDWTPAQQAIFEQAAIKWEQVIIGDLPDVVSNGTTIDDVQITAIAAPIDGAGGILGQAGPNGLRAGTFLPFSGGMQFDTEDLAALEASGNLVDVILHEMGHVLGIGTIWQSLNLVTDVGGPNPTFIGANALREYNAIFGLSAAGVPVEQDGGPGTAYAHWDEQAFDNELMTGFINNGLNPLSRITAAQLADLGYTVNLDAADFYLPSQSVSAPSGSVNGTSLGYLMVQQPTDAVIVTPNAVQAAVQPGRRPVAGDWRGIEFDQYANDRNVAIYLEKEGAHTGGVDANDTPTKAEFLGNLAGGETSSDEITRLGFEIDGSIAYDDASDIDVYRFTGIAGTEVWIDIDQTRYALDAIVELIDATGAVIARGQTNGPGGLANFQLSANSGPLTMDRDPYLGGDPNNFGDMFSINPRDPGMRMLLPGQTGLRGTYYVRVRSSPQPVSTLTNINDLNGGLSRGHYELEVRLRQTDEKPGGTIRYADIRYATNGIEVLGQPLHSPLTGEAGDREGDAPGTATNNNNSLATAQDLGNLLGVDRNTISIGGFLAGATDVDWYQFSVDFDFVQAIGAFNAAGKSWSAIFDLDYADGLTRADTTISVFDAQGQLILVGHDSNVDDDQSRPSTTPANDQQPLERGSFGENDPYIGTVQLPTGLVSSGSKQTYYVAVSSKAQAPTVLSQFYDANSASPLVRLEPVNSVDRIIEDHIGYAGLLLNNPTGGIYQAPYAPTDTLFGQNAGIQTGNATRLDLGVHATPYGLSDVVLFVARGAELFTYDPFTGALETYFGDNSLVVNNRPIFDLAMRPDGLLYGQSSGNNDQTVGNYIRIDTGNAALTNLGDDGIPLQTQGGTTVYPALTFSGLDPGNANADGFLVYAFDAANRFYYLNPQTGAVIPIPGSQSPLQQRGTVAGSGQTVFTIPAGVVGSQIDDAVDRITFTNPGNIEFEFNKPLGFVVNNVPDVNLVRPAGDLTFTFIDSGNQQVTVELDTDGNAKPGTNVRVSIVGLQAGAADAALLAERIAIGLNNRLPNSATFVGDTVMVNGSFNFSGLVDVNATQILSVDPNMTDGRLSNAAATAINITDFSTNAQIANAISAALNSQGINAGVTILPNGNAQIGITSSLTPTTIGIPGSVISVNFTPGVNIGTIQGAATVNFTGPEQLYVVTDSGYLLRLDAGNGDLLPIDPNNAASTLTLQITNPATGTPFSFTGLSRGPRFVEGESYRDILFATTSTSLVAIQVTPGQTPTLAPVLAGGQSVVVLQSTVDVARSFGPVRGLAFSTNEFNLWHPTIDNALADGHGLDDSYDGSRGPLTLDPTDRAGGTSFRFALDRSTSSGDALVGMFNADAYRFRGTGANGEAVIDTYNVPGGASGSLTSDTFSLKGYSAQDKPALYFNYLLETEGATSSPSAVDAMRDSFRVFISDDGVNWHQLTTNNSQRSISFPGGTGAGDFELPDGYQYSGGDYLNDRLGNNVDESHARVQETFDNTATWRQARVDLGDFAGKENLRLRWDFSTAGDMFEESRIRVDLTAGGTAALVGQSITLDGTDFFFRNGGIIGPNDINIAGLNTNEQVAAAIAAAVNAEFLAGNLIFSARTTGDFGTLADRTVVDEANVVVFQTGLRGLRIFTDVNNVPGIVGFSNSDSPPRWDLVNVSGTQFLPGDAYGNFESTGRGQNNLFAGVYIDDIVIGLAERGEMVTRDANAAAEDGSFTTLPFNPNPTLPVPQLVGAYQLEIRRGTEIGGVVLENASSPGQPAPLVLTRSFDTNDRLTHGFTIDTRSGALIADGSGFILNDGYRQLAFEFNKTGGVATGRIAVNITNAMTDDQVADALASAIRAVQAEGIRLDVYASTSNFDQAGVSPRPNSNRVILTGATRVDDLNATTAGSITEFGDAAGRSGFFQELGDTNLFRDQGQLIIESTRVSDSRISGIVVDAAARDSDGNRTYQGAVRQLPVRNTQRLVPGVVLVNNIVDNFGVNGIVFSGDANPADNPLAPVPYGRILHNTIYGGLLSKGVGINISDNASPSVLNNIIANTLLGIQITNSATTVLSANLFQGNTTNTSLGNVGPLGFDQPVAQPIFVDPASKNFRLRPGTALSPNLAVDSANNSLDPRPGLETVRLAVGITPSPILTPDVDALGNFRADDPLVSPPPGLGSNVFKDRGALERTDFFGPIAIFNLPRDNGPDDLNSVTNDLRVDGIPVDKFEIFLFEFTGVDDASVDAADVVITLGGQTLVEGQDYTFSYDAIRDTIVLMPVGGQFREGTYVVEILRGQGAIRDLAGNIVLPNRSNNRTLFNVVISLPGPTGMLTKPLDNGAGDLDPTVDDVTIKTATGLNQFEVMLTGEETAPGVFTPIDSTTASDPTNVELRRDGVLLVEGVDYTYTYDPATQKIRLTAIGSLFIPGDYTFEIDNSVDGGIKDTNGHPIKPNRNSGETIFNIAVELVGPKAALVNPADGGPLDSNPLVSVVDVTTNTGLPGFSIRINQDGATAINDASVTAGKLKIFRDGSATPLVSGTDYTFSYVAGTDTINVQFSAAIASQVPVSYRIELNNSASGILDSAGGRLQPNQPNGTTAFTINVQRPGPIARLTTPLDGGSADKLPAPDDVLIYTTSPVTFFDILLDDIGSPINDASVTSGKIELRRNNTALTLGTDYTFSYNAATDTIRLAAVAAEFLPGNYTIVLNNQPGTGILDTGGNPLRPNRADGSTTLNVTFGPAGPIAIPDGIFLANLGLSDVSGNTLLSFNLEGDPFTRVDVTITARSAPTGAVRDILMTSLIVDQNGMLNVRQSLPDDLNGETVTVTLTTEFGQTIGPVNIIGPRATSQRAFVASLFNKLLRRDGVLTGTVNQFASFEALGSFPAIANAFVNTQEFANTAAAGLVQSILGRAATPAEISTFATQYLTTGSFDAARIDLITRNEFLPGLPPDLSLNFNNPTHRALVEQYVLKVYATLLPGFTVSAALLQNEVEDVFEGGRKWIVSNAIDGGILGSSAYHTQRVNDVYMLCLSRSATASELAAASSNDRALLLSVISSTEYSSARIVESIYREYLQLRVVEWDQETTIDPETGFVPVAGVPANVLTNYALNFGLLRTGTPENEVRARVLASDTFLANIGGTEQAFIQNAYLQALQRMPTAGEISAASSIIAGGVANFTSRLNFTRTLFNQTLSDPSGVIQTGPLQSAPGSAPIISPVARQTTNEGSPLSLFVSARDAQNDQIRYQLAVSPAGATINPTTGQFQWVPTDNYGGTVAITVEAIEQTGSRLRTTRTFLIDVNNVAPTAAVGAPSTGQINQAQPILLVANDQGTVDQNSNFIFDIDWNGDGTFDQSISARSGTVIDRLFTTAGSQNVRIRATDKDGATSEIAQTSIYIAGITLEVDPVDPTKTNLLWTGRDGDDIVRFEQVGPTSVIVHTEMVNGQPVFTSEQFNGVTGIVRALAGGGNDSVRADQLNTIRISIDGGTGNDSLRAGKANDTVIGGDGNDTIWGVSGDDLIDGGAGNDLIFGDHASGTTLSTSRSALGSDTINGGDGNDTIYGDSDGGEGRSDYIDGGNGDDLIIGDGPVGHQSAHDTIHGGAGDDILLGDNPKASRTSGGGDALYGDSGRDILFGGGGRDYLNGGTGEDIIITGYSPNLQVGDFVNIHNQWVTGQSFATRQAFIKAQQFPGANGPSFLIPNSTIRKDQQVDVVLAGMDDEADWILMDGNEDSPLEIHPEDVIDLL